MERCQEHVYVTGEVTRSKKLNGEVERTRRCNQCSTLFKTYEMTEDCLAHKKADVQNADRELRTELAFYKRVFENMRVVFQVLEMIKDDLRMEREIEVMNDDEV